MRLMENFRAIFYAPYYAACTLGFYANQGVDVELVSSDAPGDAIAHLSNGTIGLTWGGPIRVMTAHDRSDVRTAEDGSAQDSSVNKTAKVVLIFTLVLAEWRFLDPAPIADAT